MYILIHKPGIFIIINSIKNFYDKIIYIEGLIYIEGKIEGNGKHCRKKNTDIIALI